MSRLQRSLSVMGARSGARWRRSTKWIRDRRRSRLAEPPATAITTQELGGGVFEIRLIGGERRNVLGRSTIDQIERWVDHPPAGTRVIVISAEPPDFCAGYDLLEADREGAEGLIARDDNFAELRRSKIPLVVALHGNVIGGGLELALSADIRLASPEMTMALPAGRLGLVYSETGIRLMVDALGESVSRSLLLGGREVSAESALSRGLVTEIVSRDDLRERTLEVARTIASWSSVAASGNRQILDVVMGRVEADTRELRLEGFAAHGDLLRNIHQYVVRRSRSLRHPAKEQRPTNS
jgi:enoyl-CoA hydratase/carnithine racemase